MGVVGYSWGWIFNCVALNLLPGVLAICFVAVFSIFHIYVYYFEDVLVLAKKSSLMLLTQWWTVHKALDLSKLVMVFCSTWCYTVFICRIFFFFFLVRNAAFCYLGFKYANAQIVVMLQVLDLLRQARMCLLWWVEKA